VLSFQRVAHRVRFKSSITRSILLKSCSRDQFKFFVEFSFVILILLNCNSNTIFVVSVNSQFYRFSLFVVGFHNISLTGLKYAEG